ncbi:MAG: Uma2 family endonuclease [Clostridiales bacterium]|nr:Uma2 family endonuclease [Clostridiales bacterium]
MPLPKEQIYTEDDYWNLPEDIRAELIDGKIYYMSAPNRIHQELIGGMYALIYNHIHSKKGSCRVYSAPFAVKLRKDRENTVEPDISVICDHSKLTGKGCTGAPDWIVEIISPSNPGHDYVRKLNLYDDAGVREYWIIDPTEESVMVYTRKQEHFAYSVYTFQDKIPVSVFDDFTIDFAELIADIPVEE